MKKQWIEALRSGKYKQGKGLLRRKNNCYCCLGVLAQELGRLQFSEELFMFGVRKDTAFYHTFLPDPLISGGQKTLASMNDEGATFGQIADYIEQNYDDNLNRIWPASPGK